MTYFRTGLRTIIGAKAFHCPVRDGKEWCHLAMVVRHNRLRRAARATSGAARSALPHRVESWPLGAAKVLDAQLARMVDMDLPNHATSHGRHRGSLRRRPQHNIRLHAQRAPSHTPAPPASTRQAAPCALGTAQSYRVKPHGPLVRVSSSDCSPSTPRLSTSWSTTTLQGGQAPRQISSWDEFPA